MKNRLLVAATMLASIAVAGCATSPGYGGGYSSQPAPVYGGSNASCYDCGTVIRIETLGGGKAAPNASGAVLGGIIGAVAGHEISDKTGGSKGNQNTAAVAGAVGGAIAGNAIQNKVQASNTYRIYVRMNDGRTQTVTQNVLNGVREGASVRVDNGRVYVR